MVRGRCEVEPTVRVGSRGLILEPDGLPVPGEQFVQPVLRCPGDATEDVSEPGLGCGAAIRVRRPDWDEVIEALQAPRKRRRARLTRLQLWKEYRDEALAQGARPTCYSRFCARLIGCG